MTSVIVHSDGYYSIEYVDRKVLYVFAVAIVINAASVNRILGSIEGFVKLYRLYGQTNGELLILRGHDTIEFLIATLDDVLNPEGFQNVLDYVILWKKSNYSTWDFMRLMEHVSFDWNDYESADWLKVIKVESEMYAIARK